MLKTINTIITQIARSLQSNTSTGLMQITGPAAGATRTVTIPDANATMARTDAAQSFTGDQTLATGNLVIGTAGKGIDFSATPGTGTSELFSDYEEGTWTPTFSGWSVNSTKIFATYTKVGRLVTLNMVMYQGTSLAGASIGGLPYTSGNSGATATGRTNNNSSAEVTGLVLDNAATISYINAFTTTDYWEMSVTYST